MTKKVIDLRSDTVTKPSSEMMDAMFSAPVGDDVFGEDPTVNALEEKTARMFGHEAGLFCPSGTMTNQIAIQVHTSPGDEVICHSSSHVYNYEGGGIARNAAASTKLVHNDGATMSIDEVRALVNEDFDWLANTSLVVAEDTSNRGGGKCYNMTELEALSSFCKESGLAFHLDGARVMNSIVEKNHNLLAYGKLFDTISICLSKGLGTPVGSVLIGSKAFIKEARRVRKVMGGGMRQAGILAAAGIYALDNNVNRLKDDHQRAKELANALSRASQVRHVIPPETNIVLFDLESQKAKESVLAHFEKEGLRAVSFGPARIRMVTHLDITAQDIERSIEVITKVLN